MLKRNIKLIEEIKKLAEEGYLYKEIVEKVSKNITYVVSICNKNGIKVRRKEKEGYENYKNHIISLLKENKSISEIAKLFKVSRQSISGYMKYHNIEYEKSRVKYPFINAIVAKECGLNKTYISFLKKKHPEWRSINNAEELIKEIKKYQENKKFNRDKRVNIDYIGNIKVLKSYSNNNYKHVVDIICPECNEVIYGRLYNKVKEYEDNNRVSYCRKCSYNHRIITMKQGRKCSKISIKR